MSRIFPVCADRGIAPDGTKGAAVHLRGLAAAFAADHEVTLFAARPPDDGHGLPVAVRRFEGASTLLEAARDGRPDVIYERYSLGALGGLHAARALGVPFVLEVNAPLVHEASIHRPASLRPDDRTAEVDLLGEADLVVTVSTVLARHLEPFRGGRATVVVPNGCDPALFAEEPRPAPSPTVAFLGHPKPWHGARRLPSMLAGLSRRGHDVRLLVVGGGEGADEVLAEAARRRVADRVTVTGPCSQGEAARLIGGAWVGVAPYPPDPFFYFSPIKIVEYLAAGIPVVAGDLGDNALLVGDAGILVDPGDDDAFVDAVAALLTDPERRGRFGRAGRRRAFGTLTWDAAARTTLDAIRDLAGAVV